MKRITLFKIVAFVILSVSLPLFSNNSYAVGPTYVGGTYSTNQTWTPDGSPYIVNSDLVVNNCAILTITTTRPNGGEAPVEVKFNAGKGLRLGSLSLSSKSYGKLIAQGSENCPITFTTNSPGQYWKGIYFMWNPTKAPENELCGLFNNSYHSLQYCTIENGGWGTLGSDRANISLFCSDATVSHCTIRNSQHDGVYIEGTYNSGTDYSTICYGKIYNSVITGNKECGVNIHGDHGYSFPLINGTEISHNDTYGVYCSNFKGEPNIQGENRFLQNGSYPLRIPASVSLPSGTTFTGNGQQAIEMIGKNIAANTTWCNFGIPYIVRNGNITVYNGSYPYPTKTLTINPGTTIKFDPDLGLYLGHAFTGTVQCGVLNAVGTKEQPITFTTSSPGQYWSGILFKWGTSSQSRLNYCTIEYAGAHFAELEVNIEHDAAVSFWESSPSAETIKNSTVRYSKADGIKIHNNDSGSATIKNCNIYSNDLYDFIDFQNNQNINAQLNYWGTSYGPSQDLCSSAVVSETVLYEAWLEEEFSDPFRFTSAGANPKKFNPITGTTTFSFTLSQPGNWTLSVLNQQFEKVWSKSGTNSSGETVTWNGMGDEGIVSGVCYYRIEAENSNGTASPVMGTLNLGDQTIARITQPLSHTLFTPGTDINIEGIAIVGGGYYEVKYGVGENPTSWNSIAGPTYSSKQNEKLATWNTTGLDQPTYTIKLDVNNSGTVYSDLVIVDFLIEETEPSPDSGIIYTYDSHGRLTGVKYPDGSSIHYTYDRVGNRLAVIREGETPPTLIHLAYFKAEPTPNGVLLQWKTESEINTEGFNLYRKRAEEKDYGKINSSLLPARGGAISGADYSFLDLPPQRSEIYSYLLEEVDTAGHTKRHGPVSSKNLAIRSPDGRRTFKKSFNVSCD